jgi:ABC-type transport system involved in cytochrome c biogenesis permease subunit
MAIISGISVFCFAASYTVALALEVVRMFFRSDLPLWLTRGFAGAGLLAQTLFLAYRAANATTTPLSSAFEWNLLGAWGLVVVYLYLSWTHPRTAVGLFLLPLVLGLIALAHFFASQQPFPQSEAGKVWGAIHGVFLLLGLVAVTVGFVAGLMYLIQSYRLKHKRPPVAWLRLPSLEWLERISIRAIWISALAVGVGFGSGIVLNLVLHQRQMDELPWSDPVIWRTALMFAWLLAVAIFSAIYRPARSGRKVAYLTLANFAFLAASVAVGMLLPSEHGVEKKAEGGRRKAEVVAVSGLVDAQIASRASAAERLADQSREIQL